MVRLIQFVLASYALWFVFSQSDLPGWWKLRDRLIDRFTGLAAFLFCPMCSGFWCSLAMSALLPIDYAERASFVAQTAGYLAQALARATAVLLLDLLVRRAERS
jgi:hypothetical protein